MSYLLCYVVKGSHFISFMLDIISTSLDLNFSAMVVMVSFFLSSGPKGGDTVYNRVICAFVRRLYIHMSVCLSPQRGLAWASSQASKELS